MKVAALVEARMGSSRLPGKTLMPILGRPMLCHLIDRLRRAATLQDIVIATSTAARDADIANLCADEGVACFRGSEGDVLDRVLRAAQANDIDVIAEITADCPLLDPHVVDRVVNRFLAGGCDFAWNNLVRTYPVGFGVRVFSRQLLAQISTVALRPEHREHVSLYVWEHPELFRIANVASDLPARTARYRLVVDTAADFALIREIFEALAPDNPDFSLADVLDLLNRRPDLEARALDPAWGLSR